MRKNFLPENILFTSSCWSSHRINNQQTKKNTYQLANFTIIGAWTECFYEIFPKVKPQKLQTLATQFVPVGTGAACPCMFVFVLNEFWNDILSQTLTLMLLMRMFNAYVVVVLRWQILMCEWVQLAQHLPVSIHSRIHAHCLSETKFNFEQVKNSNFTPPALK